MYHTISTQKAFGALFGERDLGLPMLLQERLREVLETFDENYGADRQHEADLGGYCVVFPRMAEEERGEYETILQKYHIQQEEREYRDELVRENGLVWIEELFILSADYGIVFFYPEEIENGGYTK